MNVSGTGHGSMWQIGTSGMPGLRHTPRQNAVIRAVAPMVGMTPLNLQKALDSGKSLSDIATQAGVSAFDLDKAIRNATLLADG